MSRKEYGWEDFCCDEFQKIVVNPESVFNRETTFRHDEDGNWFTDFSDHEYGDIQLIYCPFCGSKLRKLFKW